MNEKAAALVTLIEAIDKWDAIMGDDLISDFCESYCPNGYWCNEDNVKACIKNASEWDGVK